LDGQRDEDGYKHIRTQLRLHAALPRDTHAGVADRRGDGTEERAADVAHPDGDELVERLDLVPVLEPKLLRAGEGGEEGDERDKARAGQHAVDEAPIPRPHPRPVRVRQAGLDPPDYLDAERVLDALCGAECGAEPEQHKLLEVAEWLQPRVLLEPLRTQQVAGRHGAQQQRRPLHR